MSAGKPETVSQPLRIRARWALQPDGTVVDAPLLEIADGRIVNMSAGLDAGALDLGDVAIAAGFVNAHVHLDLPGPRIPAGKRHPTEWLRAGVVTQRTRVYQTPRDIQRGLLVGVSIKKVEGALYFFNPGSDDYFTVVSLSVSF